MPWVDPDSSDEEDLPRKTPLNVNGTAVNGNAKPKSNGTSYKKQRISSPMKNIPADICDQRTALPIASGRDAIVEQIRQNDVTVLIGETEVPQYLLESSVAGTGLIAVTQPRRVAATSLAARVATEQGTSLGGVVGYAVRFDESTGPDTRIKFMTDGMLARELLSDPLLSKYSAVVVDEAHERTVTTDILLSNLKAIQKERNNASGKGKEKANPLKIVVMSATLDADKFAKFFTNAKILYVKGRQHPVKIYYSSIDHQDYTDAALATFFQIHTDQPAGDVLIFLPGQEDIESLQNSIESLARRLPATAMDVRVCTMYAAQAPGQNSKVFARTPANTRKCILATNIAETSITIPGVKYVIDTGKCKEKWYLSSGTTGMNTLVTRDISQSSAAQRAGRAGREGLGHCYRLYTEDAYDHLAVSAQPEIMRCSLANHFLELLCIGQNMVHMDLMDKPDAEKCKPVQAAAKTLFLLGALTNKMDITPVGRQMVKFPLEPHYARAVVAAHDLGCTAEVLSIVALLSASSKLFVDITEQRENITEIRRKFRHPTGDHLTALNVWKAYEDLSGESASVRKEWCRKHFVNERALGEAKDIREQLRQVCRREKIDPLVTCGEDDEKILQSLGHGLVQNAAFLQPDGSYKQVVGGIVNCQDPSKLDDV
ncbi:P-loop containing nucleoside triphosphate hydrolase protein [Cylindrobasidium torrendii FP15055 ss-10]|uniref:RNA helicase n=1 Tax=Cylindrobasidium torrendii FP15055 ss-10 TaxID=1314674 RepID=A0A0D7B0E5_9AGAR|nr:P-loop containing nucleoside triphosphate hydrolase protein [Cylindrobasidium torrendii FP15055 ss-10]